MNKDDLNKAQPPQTKPPQPQQARAPQGQIKVQPPQAQVKGLLAPAKPQQLQGELAQVTPPVINPPSGKAQAEKNSKNGEAPNRMPQQTRTAPTEAVVLANGEVVASSPTPTSTPSKAPVIKSNKVDSDDDDLIINGEIISDDEEDNAPISVEKTPLENEVKKEVGKESVVDTLKTLKAGKEASDQESAPQESQPVSAPKESAALPVNATTPEQPPAVQKPAQDNHKTCADNTQDNKTPRLSSADIDAVNPPKSLAELRTKTVKVDEQTPDQANEGAEEAPPVENNFRAYLKNTIKPNGHWNRNIIGILAVALGICFFIFVHSMKKARAAQEAEVAEAAEKKAEAVKQTRNQPVSKVVFSSGDKPESEVMAPGGDGYRNNAQLWNGENRRGRK
jgi:hypothetical protein